MPTNDWQRVEELFHATLQLGDAARSAYLARECAGDGALRREVESLVAAYESEHSFIEQPALSIGMRLLSDEMSGESLEGCSIGHYKIVRLLGKGGMGEVYLAEDSVLERPVALKFISNHFVGDEWAREQLMKEARAVARLENSNICAVYGVEGTESHNFIVMQYVEGETLASLLRNGSPALEQTLDLAEQMVGALSAAHARGVIHRDVKPQNIIVSADGHVKVLDFGLAKLVRQKQESDGASNAADQTWHFGLVVGTVAYMSPEQTRGEELDCRSDIFSLGIVLYEMLGGRNPFLRQTQEDTLSAINAEEPPALADLPPDMRDGLAAILRKCLEKQRERRYENADHLLLDLRALRRKRERRRAPVLAAEPPVPKRRRHLRGYAAASLALLLLLITGLALVYQKLSRVHTLAVLPISNRSADPELNYLSKGLTRNLYDKLSYLPQLRVKLPAVAAPAAGGEEEKFDPVKYGRELKVDAILSGEIVRRDGSLLLNVSMLNTTDGSRNWEQTFNVDVGDIFSLQDKVARNVAAGLGLWLVGGEQRLLAKRQTDNEDALRFYMRGRDLWSVRNKENIQKAVEFFEQAVKLDPAFAEAYAGLADSYMLLNLVSYGSQPTSVVMDKARFNVNRALYINDTLCDAHTSLATIKMRYDWDWYEAEREFKLAIALNPDYAPARYGYSNFLAVMGRFDESIRESEAAKSLDPYSPLAVMNYGRALYFARRTDEAEAEFRRMLEKDADNASALYMHGLALMQAARYADALAPLEKLYLKEPLFAAAALGYAYGKLGRRDDALGVLRKLDEVSNQQGTHVPPQERAIVYIGLGDRDQAFALLEEAYAERFASLIYLTTESLFDDLRPDPRFATLARRMKLTP